MMQNANLAALSAAGVSIWLDDLSRDRLESGNLQQLIETRSIVGVTTNPSIFEHAISHGHAYDQQFAELADRGVDAQSAIRAVPHRRRLRHFPQRTRSDRLRHRRGVRVRASHLDADR